jgi:hypothetical protein
MPFSCKKIGFHIDTLISGFHSTLLKYQLQMTSDERARWTYNCCRDIENKLKLGKGPLKLFRDRSNTVKLEDWLKINAGSIGPSNLFILKFLKNNLQFPINNEIKWFNNIQKKGPIWKLVRNISSPLDN